MINRNKNGILVLMALFVAVLMIGIPISAAATPSAPSYLASGSSMNYIFTNTGYTFYQNYSKSDGMTIVTTNNVTSSPATTYYNVSVSASNKTAVDITVPTSTGSTTYSNMPISMAKYSVPIFISKTSKNVTLSMNGESGCYGANYNETLNYTKTVNMPYYKAPFGTVKATEYIISESMKVPSTSRTGASYYNITGNVYVNSATDLILSATVIINDHVVSSGTTATNETYVNTCSNSAITLESSSVVPIHTNYTGAYIGIVVAAVLLGVVVYYFYARKPATPKTAAGKESKEENSKTK